MALIVSQPFPSSPYPITLTQICDQYGVTRNMGALKGLAYYSSRNDPSTGIIVPDANINLGDFRGKYYYSNGKITDQYTRNSFSGIQGEMGFYDGMYALTGGVLTHFKITLYINTRNQGAGINHGYNSQNTRITIGGVIKYSGRVIGVLTITDLSGKPGETLAISVSTNISGSLGQGQLFMTWTYTISKTGLIGPFQE
jgi:hypothetical protein